jgi:acyl-CoA dehydrogenase
MSDPGKRFEIHFGEEQEQLLDVATSFARDKFPLSKTREHIAAREDFDATVWRDMAALGWLGIAVPDEFGGSTLGLGEAVPVAEALGRQVAGTPFVSTTLAAQALLKAGTAKQQSDWLPKLCQGGIGALALGEPGGDWNLERIACKAARRGASLWLSGTKTFVTDAASADCIITSVMLDDVPALILLTQNDLETAKIERETVIDETRRSYRLVLDGVSVPADNLLDAPNTKSCLAHLHLAACLLLSAEMCGGASGVIDVTADYLKTRKQFGRYIGSYQALKHPLVDALLAYEAARSHLYYAASVFNSEEGEIAVRMAKAVSSDALAFASDRAIQFHGGFGFTYDCDAQLYRRRGIWCEYQHGDAAFHRQRLAALVLG